MNVAARDFDADRPRRGPWRLLAFIAALLVGATAAVLPEPDGADAPAREAVALLADLEPASSNASDARAIQDGIARRLEQWPYSYSLLPGALRTRCSVELDVHYRCRIRTRAAPVYAEGFELVFAEDAQGMLQQVQVRAFRDWRAPW